MTQIFPRIVQDKSLLAGKPVVAGTRIAVEQIIGHLAHGWTEEAILNNYPQLGIDDIRACLAYAHRVLQSGNPAQSAA